MKICNKCGIEKPLDLFYKKQSKCKSCCAEKQRQDKEKTNAKTAKWRRANKEAHNAAVKNWRLNNPEKQAESCRNWREKNPNYEKDRKEKDPVFKISCNLRRRINHIIKDDYKAGSAIRDLGCTPEQLKEHLESKFQVGMSWQNYGYYGWHIDHIKPLSSFDLQNKEEFLEASHYTNLQPMWAKDNLSKGNKL